MLLLSSNVMQSLNMMWQGMLGIFIVVGVIALSVVVLTKITDKNKKNRK